MDIFSLESLSVPELRRLSKAHFASYSMDELECLLVRMGVAISLQERTNKEYYLNKVMELIAELIANKSKPFYSPFAPLPPTLFPRTSILQSASSFAPSQFSPQSQSFASSTNVYPSAPPLLTLPPFASPDSHGYPPGTLQGYVVSVSNFVYQFTLIPCTSMIPHIRFGECAQVKNNQPKWGKEKGVSPETPWWKRRRRNGD